MTNNPNTFDGVNDIQNVLSTGASYFESSDTTAGLGTINYNIVENNSTMPAGSTTIPPNITGGENYLDYLSSLYTRFTDSNGNLSGGSGPNYGYEFDVNLADTWWSYLTGGSSPLPQNYSDLLQYLSSKGYITIEAPTTTNAQGTENAFNTEISSFIAEVNNGTISLPANATQSDYGSAFVSYLQAALPTTQEKYNITFTNTATNTVTTLPSALAPSVLGNTANPALFNSIFQNFMFMLQNTPDSGSSTDQPLIDYSSLTTDQLDSLFSNSIGSFLQYAIQNPTTFTANYTNWNETALTFALINYPNSNLLANQQAGQTSTGITAFQALWDAYYPNDPQDFLPSLMSYIQSQVATTGSFQIPTSVSISQLTQNQQTGAFSATTTPSGSLAGWSNLLRESATGTTAGLDPLSEGDYQDVAIVLQVYDKLLDLLNALQIMTASQLQMQSFFQEFQNAYTTLEGRIPNITGATQGLPQGLTGWGSANASAVQIRSDISQLATQYTESVKSFRSEVQDMSSQQNTAVNQSQESVTQQVNVAQTLIQQFSTILQSIWR